MRKNHSPAIQYAGFGVLLYHSISLRRNASRYALLTLHSLPIFSAGMSCWLIIFRTCCFVVFSNAAVSATVSSSVTPTGHHPFDCLHFSCPHNTKNYAVFAHQIGSSPSLPLRSSVGWCRIVHTSLSASPCRFWTDYRRFSVCGILPSYYNQCKEPTWFTSFWREIRFALVDRSRRAQLTPDYNNVR